MAAAEQSDAVDREFKEYWDSQLLEYPTISRDEAGKWNYFDVEPEYPAASAQAEDLARQTLALASRYYEADSTALSSIVEAAYEAQKDPDPDRSFVAYWFIEEILSAAIRGRR